MVKISLAAGALPYNPAGGASGASWDPQSTVDVEAP